MVGWVWWVLRSDSAVAGRQKGMQGIAIATRRSCVSLDVDFEGAVRTEVINFLARESAVLTKLRIAIQCHYYHYYHTGQSLCRCILALPSTPTLSRSSLQSPRFSFKGESIPNLPHFNPNPSLPVTAIQSLSSSFFRLEY